MRRCLPTARRIRQAALALAGASLLALALAAVEIARLPHLPALLASARGSTVLLDREGNPIRYALTAEGLLAPWARLSMIHPALIEATIAAEDARFRRHGGVDLLACTRAAWSNLRRGRIVSGASTLTMQVARLLRPLPRSWYGKFREAVLACALERALSKDDILELYLNLSPYGGNARGVEAGARRWFGRSCGDLSLSEAALLAGLPQSPARLRPDRNPQAARARRDWILRRMASLGAASPPAAAVALSAEVMAAARPLPLTAPHFGAWALARTPPGTRVRTSLDPGIQAMLDRMVRSRLEALGAAAARNGAAVVVETDSGRIRALVGSQDFHEPRDGQVNGANARRSPGSLLKPFIYGLAFERGIAGPQTLLDDSPRRYPDGYDPRNFDQRFRGPVRARDALARSLNVPAVDLLARLGARDTAARLRSFGLELDGAGSRAGLTLALGGVELTLLEIVEAYASLGRLGLHRPLSAREDEEPPPARRVLSAEASLEVAEALEDAGWPRGEREAGLDLPRAALKTGTSFGFRDAWAVAYTPRWTVGFWFGNFDGAPGVGPAGEAGEARPGLAGQHAAPAALAILRQLETGGRRPWFARPPETGAEDAEAKGRGERKAAPPVLGPAPSPRLSWIAPDEGGVYRLHDRPGGDRLALRVESPPAEAVFFFVNGRLAGRADPGAAFEWPCRPGRHRLVAVAASGESAVRSIRVEGRAKEDESGPVLPFRLPRIDD